MSLHTEDHSSGQDHWPARILRLLLIVMKKLKKSGCEYPRYEEIIYETGSLFPQYYLPNYALNPALQLLCHTGLLVADTSGFRLTQAGQDFDLKQTERLTFGTA